MRSLLFECERSQLEDYVARLFGPLASLRFFFLRGHGVDGHWLGGSTLHHRPMTDTNAGGSTRKRTEFGLVPGHPPPQSRSRGLIGLQGSSPVSRTMESSTLLDPPSR